MKSLCVALIITGVAPAAFAQSVSLHDTASVEIVDLPPGPPPIPIPPMRMTFDLTWPQSPLGYTASLWERRDLFDCSVALDQRFWRIDGSKLMAVSLRR